MGDALAGAQNELSQVRAAVVKLREALERSEYAKQDALAAMRAQHQSELNQLHQTITALRGQLQGAPVRQSG